MILIKKGPAPGVLTGDGSAFQKSAIIFERDFPAVGSKLVATTGVKRTRKAGGGTAEPKKRRQKKAAPGINETLASYTKVDANGKFSGFLSKLFGVYKFYSHVDVKSKLLESHYGKCAFCESFILSTDVGDVEHYRPKAEVTERDPYNLENERDVTTHPGYYWLSQTWENLLLSCKQCNQAYKGNLFDVVLQDSGSGIQQLVRTTALGGTSEMPVLLFPGGGDVDPRTVLRYDPSKAEAVMYTGDPSASQVNQVRAYRTIQMVGLNRLRLIEARAAHLVKLRTLFILAASGGGWQLDRPDQPDILRFQYPQEGPWMDAQTGLAESIKPYSEFSSMAMDAIIAWNKELKLEAPKITVALQQPAQKVFVNTSVTLPLMPWLTLHATARTKAGASIKGLSQPDTRGPDGDYNACLIRYKRLCLDVLDNQDDILEAVDELTQISRQRKLLDEAKTNELRKIVNWEEPQFETDERLAGTQRELNAARHEGIVIDRGMILAKGDRARALNGVPSEEVAQQIFASSQRPPDQQQAASVAARQRTGEHENTIVELQKLKAVLAEAAKPFDDEDERLEAESDAVSDPRDGFFLSLEELRDEANELANSYRSCGAEKERSQRCELLEQSASDLYDFLDSMTRTPLITQQLQNTGWPPAIRMK